MALALSSSDVGGRARRRTAARLLPFVFVLYVANYLDRANLAYATLRMSRDLGFGDRVFGTAAGIFFIGYLTLQIPGALMVERWSARRLISGIMILWGGLTVLTGSVHTSSQLYAARFVLGVAEAGFFPGVIVYLSHWFIYEDRAKAVANFMGAIPVSFAIGSPLAGLMLGVHWWGIQGWRWLFLLEGLPAILLGVVALFYLPDWPAEARWLPAEERDWITARLEQEKQAKADVRAYSVWNAMRYPPVIILALVVLFEYTAGYAFQFWFPTILKRLSELSDLRVTLLGSLPYIVGFLAMQVAGWHSDRTGERRWHTAAPCFISAGALLLLIGLSPGTDLSVALFTVVGVQAAFLPCFWTLPPALLSESAAAVCVGLINLVGSVGGFVGPYVMGYLYSRTHSFTAGLAFMTAGFALSGLLVLFCPDPRRAKSSAATAPVDEAEA